MKELSQDYVLKMIESRLVRLQNVYTSNLDMLLIFLFFAVGVWYAYGSIVGGFLAGYAIVIIKAVADVVVCETIKTDIFRIMDEHLDDENCMKAIDKMNEIKAKRRRFL